MSIILNVNGVDFDYPETGDQRWGPDATDWAVAVTSGMLQKTGGLFILLAEVDFGGSFGIKSVYYKTRTANVADSGQFRLARTDVVNWRNQANSTNLGLGVNSSDQLTFNGTLIQSSVITVSDTSTIDMTLAGSDISAAIVTGSITNAMINASAAIAYSKLNLSNSIVNADINASAAIAYSKLNLVGSIVNADVNASAAIARTKLSALTASRVLVSDGSGFDSASSVTTTTLGYLDATSSIQTQLNGKLSLSGGSMTGAIAMGTFGVTGMADPVNPQDAATKAYVDSVAEGLSVKAPVVVASTGNLTLSGEQTIDGVLTSASRVLVKDQSAPAQNGIYVTAAGAWARSSDANTWAELVSAFTFVQSGTTQADTGWVCTVSPGGTIGVTAVTFVQFSSAGIILAGNGLTKTGNTLSVNVDNSTTEISGNNVIVKDLGITAAKIANTTITNAQINASAAIVYSKLSLTNSILNADINASAAIALTKLAATTVSRALVSDGSGFVSPATTTATEIGYVNGVTSAIQTQLNGKLPTTITTTGDLIYSSSGTTAARRAIGSTGNVLTVSGGLPVWSAPAYINPTVTAIAGTLTLTSVDSGKIYLISTAAARTVNLPAPVSGLIFTFKDSTGQANTNNITVVRNGGTGSIEGVAASKILQTNWGSWTFVSDGTNWFIIN